MAERGEGGRERGGGKRWRGAQHVRRGVYWEGVIYGGVGKKRDKGKGGGAEKEDVSSNGVISGGIEGVIEKTKGGESRRL